MGSILSAISDDIDDYISLCRFFCEKPVNDKFGPNPYSDHARELKRKYRILMAWKR